MTQPPHCHLLAQKTSLPTPWQTQLLKDIQMATCMWYASEYITYTAPCHCCKTLMHHPKYLSSKPLTCHPRCDAGTSFSSNKICSPSVLLLRFATVRCTYTSLPLFFFFHKFSCGTGTCLCKSWLFSPWGHVCVLCLTYIYLNLHPLTLKHVWPFDSHVMHLSILQRVFWYSASRHWEVNRFATCSLVASSLWECICLFFPKNISCFSHPPKTRLEKRLFLSPSIRDSILACLPSPGPFSSRYRNLIRFFCAGWRL